MKGITKIELTNVKTGEVKTYEKHNIVTNAVKDILQQNPYTIRYIGNRAKSYNGILWRDIFFPIYEKMFGGILIYKTALTADATKYHQPAELTGYADGGTNPGSDNKRGTRNLTESGPVTGGYKYVYDFTTSQGNGTIACISLTHSYAGATGFGFIGIDLNNNAEINDMLQGDIKSSADYSYKPAVEGICCIDSDGIGISVMPTDTKKIKIRKYKTGLSHIMLMCAPFDKLINESEITTTTFGEKGSDSDNEWFNLAFIDGGDDYIWGFQFSGNLKYTNESPTLNWIKIKKSDLTFTEGTTVLTGCTCWRPGIVEYTKSTSGRYQHKIYTSCLVYNGYLYLLGKEYTKLYKVNLSNMADISEITLPAACDVDSVSAGLPYSRYLYGFSALNLVGETIVGSNFYLAGNMAHARANGSSALQVSRPGISKGAYLVGIDFMGGLNGASETAPLGSYRYVTLPLNYQATINNLDTPVTKTAEQTMKITYTLTEE